jgi:hypothetical protein
MDIEMNTRKIVHLVLCTLKRVARLGAQCAVT